MRKLSTWVAVAFLVFFISTNPGGAAAVGKSLLAGLADVADGLGRFVTGIAS